jgi:hypothetical protein
MIGSLPSLRSTRNPAVALLGLLVVVWLGYQAAELVLAGALDTLAVTAIAVAAGAIVIAILNDWHRGLYLFLAWVLFEDLFRKYFGNNMAIFFAKDVLVLVIYLSFFISNRARRAKAFRPPFLVPLLLFIWWGLIQFFNPASTSVFYGLLGIKIYFLYVPLLYVGYAFLESERDLQNLFTFNSILIILVAGLGIVQAILGASFLNPHTLQEDIRDVATLYRASPITGLISYRPCSVFVSTGRFANFVIVSWVLALGYGGYLLLRSRRHRPVAFLTIAAVGIAAIMSTSRGTFLWSSGSGLILLAAFLWGAPWRQGEVRRVLRTIQRTFLVAGFALMGMVMVFPEQVGARFALYSETLSPDSPASELVFRTRDYPLHNLMLAFSYEHWATGYGIGTASLGIQYVTRIFHAPPMGVNVENGYGQIMLELGIVGLALWIVLAISIVFSAWRVVKSLRQTPWFPIAFSIFWYAFLLLIPMSYIGFIVYQDYVMNAYLWLLLGILFRLPEIAKKSAAVQLSQTDAATPGQA